MSSLIFAFFLAILLGVLIVYFVIAVANNAHTISILAIIIAIFLVMAGSIIIVAHFFDSYPKQIIQDYQQQLSSPIDSSSFNPINNNVDKELNSDSIVVLSLDKNKIIVPQN